MKWFIVLYRILLTFFNKRRELVSKKKPTNLGEAIEALEKALDEGNLEDPPQVFTMAPGEVIEYTPSEPVKLTNVAYGFAQDTDLNWYVVTIPYDLKTKTVGTISQSHPDGSRGVVMERYMIEHSNGLLVNE
jgi:hypothetical protein